MARATVRDQNDGDDISYRGRVAWTGPSRARAPGRVTILGEHTDYNEGRSLGIATTQGTVVLAEAGRPDTVEVTSSSLGTASCPVSRPDGPGFVVLAAALAGLAGVDAVRLDVSGDLPVGAGVSSSASYAVAVALALGLEGTVLEVARACQAAERSTGSDVGLLDPLVILAAREGSVVGLDFAGPTVDTFALHPAIGLSVVDSGERRSVSASAYATRRAECTAAAASIGPLGRARRRDLDRLTDPVLRRRARHVVTECDRVDVARGALHAGDLATLGRLLDEGHVSLRDDFEVSTPQVEAVRDRLAAHAGVVGVRLCGAGFGGCLVVAHDPGVEVAVPGAWASRLVGAGGASVSWRR